MWTKCILFVVLLAAANSTTKYKFSENCDCRQQDEVTRQCLEWDCSGEIKEKLQCLSLDSYLDTPSGPVQIKYLAPGNTIWSVDANGKLVEDQIYDFLHYSEEPAVSLTITLSSGNNFSIFDRHRVFLSDGLDVEADELKVGMELQTTGSELITVAGITIDNHQGFAAPLTYTGKYVSHGVVISNYAIQTHNSAHYWAAPLRIWHSVVGPASRVRNGIHPYAKLSMYLVGIKHGEEAYFRTEKGARKSNNNNNRHKSNNGGDDDDEDYTLRNFLTARKRPFQL